MKKFLILIIFSITNYFYLILILNKFTNILNIYFGGIIHIEIILLSIGTGFIYKYLYYSFYQKISFKNIFTIIYPFTILYISFILINFQFIIPNYRFSNPLGFNKHIFGAGIIFFGIINYLNISFLLYKIKSIKNQITIFLIILFILYSIIGFWTTIDGDGGDEWVYRVMAESFANDLDFNLVNNVEKQYWYPGILAVLSPEKVYAKYYPLYSIAISPVFWIEKIFSQNGIFYIFQNIGSPIVPFSTSFLLRTYNIIFALLSVYCIIYILKNIYFLKINWLFFASLFIFTPFSIYATQIYPEIFAGLFTIIFFIIYYENIKEEYKFNKSAFLLIIIPLIMCWIHARFFFIVLIFIIANSIKLFKQKKYFFIILYLFIFIVNIFFIYMYQKDIPSDQNLGEVIVTGIFNFFDYNRIKTNFYLNISDYRQSITFNFPFLYFIIFYVLQFKKNNFYATINYLVLAFILFMIFQPIITGAGHASPALRFYVYLFPLILVNIYFLFYKIINNKFLLSIYTLIFTYTLINSLIVIFFQRLRYINIIAYFIK